MIDQSARAYIVRAWGQLYRKTDVGEEKNLNVVPHPTSSAYLVQSLRTSSHPPCLKHHLANLSFLKIALPTLNKVVKIIHLYIPTHRMPHCPFPQHLDFLFFFIQSKIFQMKLIYRRNFLTTFGWKRGSLGAIFTEEYEF